MDEEQWQIVKQRMDEARETLLEAETLLGQDLRRGVINRFDVETTFLEAKTFVNAIDDYLKNM